MKSFEADVKDCETHLLISLKGQIDEDVDFSKIVLADAKKVVFDWNQVKGINSCGVREWLRWIAEIAPSRSIMFQNCPRVIVNQVNLINGFLPRGAKIDSLYVPYYCVSCETATSVLVPNSTKDSTPTTATCSKCGKDTDLDVVVSKYFRFMDGTS